MDLFAAIPWNVEPEIVELFGGALTLRWYGVLFALAFLLDYHIVRRMFTYEHKSQRDLETLTIYVVVATIVGARLGHCLFYDFDYYISNPVEILYVWKGGLASHGGALGILAALYLYARTRPDQPFLWIADRIAVVAALSGALIRLGNLFNSEIYGVATDLPWGFVFLHNPEAGAVPRHPTQIYESVFYFITFIILYRRYNARRATTPHGSLLGLFLILVFGFRFFVEFLKVHQSDFETALPLNMGQWLSIPFVALGVYLLKRARPVENASPAGSRSR